MMRHTSTIVAVPSQADTRLSSIGVTWTTNALGGTFLPLWIARLPLSHGPIVLRSPVNGAKRACKGLLPAAGCDARYRNSKSSAGYTHVEPRLFLQIWPFRIPNLDSRFLVGQPEPVVRRFVLQAVHSKTRLDTTRLQDGTVGRTSEHLDAALDLDVAGSDPM
jgi:hypothetical protein